MPNIAPNVTISTSDYVNTAIPIDTEPSYHFFSERNGYTTSMPPIPTTDIYTFELGRDDILKELMNRIYKLELEVHELKQQLNQGGTIKL